jgi:HAD superfamily hydrolase (TIGR01509 family)
MKYKAIIFDMDGVILDTEIIESRSFASLLTEYQVEPRPNQNGLLHEIGGGGTYFEDFKAKYSLSDSVEIIRDKKRDYFKKIIEEEGLVPFSGFIELLDLLKKEKLTIALASNRNESFIHLILDALKVKHYFDTIVGPSDTRKHKPSPDIYLHTAKEINVKPEDCVVLEDTETGINSAKAAGMKVIAIPNVYVRHQDFSKADIIVTSLSDININLLESL